MCLRDFEEIWAFWEENGTFGKKSVRKGHFDEIWTVKVKTGLIQKEVCEKELKWKLGLLDKFVVLGKLSAQKCLLG